MSDNSRGKRYYNNGIINKMIMDGDPIPEGFTLGRKPLSEERKKEIADKKRKTFAKNYGIGSVGYDDLMHRRKKTTLDRYGVEYSWQSDIVKEKIKETNLEKYGTEYPMRSEEIKDRLRKSFLEKYGVDHPQKSEEVKERTKRTNLERYGTEYTLQSDIVKEKIKETNLERYGVENPSQSQEIKEKKAQTCLQHYGVDHHWKSKEIQEHMRNGMVRKYGVENPAQLEEVKERIRETNVEKYGVDWACMRPEARLGYTNNSTPNREFASLLDENKISYEREFSLERYVYDFKVGNTLIEIDPFPTHNTLWSPFNHDKGISEDYHIKKSQTALDNGYVCIHVFDWDDKSKVIDLLKKRERLFARNLSVFGIDNKECREYLNQYHLQGSCNGQSVKLGLRDKFGNLVSLMTFGKPRYNKNYEYELLRYCSSAFVVGGAEKLFSHFKRDYDPESIISYCDKSKFRGDVYDHLGFTLKSDSRPSKHWYSPNEKERMRHITDNFLRQRGYDQIFGANFGKGTSNEELIIERGYLPIYDCGQSTYVWKK